MNYENSFIERAQRARPKFQAREARAFLKSARAGARAPNFERASHPYPEVCPDLGLSLKHHYISFGGVGSS